MRDASRDLPIDSMPKIIRKIPRECFELKPWKSILALFMDFGMIVVLMFMIVWSRTWAIALPLSLLMGTVMTGLFVIGHDAGHRSLSYSEKINNFFGHLATTPLLWPFHVWRLSHDVHHRWTHHAEKEIAWKPFTPEKYAQATPVVASVYKATRTGLFFWASIFFQWSYIIDGLKDRFFKPEDKSKVLFSIWLTFITGIVYAGLSFWIAGFYGFLWLFLVPHLTYHFWLSTFTLFHHTNLKNTLMDESLWTPEKAQLAHTVHVGYHPVIDLLTHDISWHVPHHVCVGIPFYHLRTAHKALKEAYPDVVTERVFGRHLLKEVLSNCHLTQDEEDGSHLWRTFSEVRIPVRKDMSQSLKA